MYFYIPITKFHTVDEAINILSLTPAVVSPSSKIGFNFSFSAEVSARYSGTGAQWPFQNYLIVIISDTVA